jgi:3-phosphoshikimate 1-carboxyvinyltransferase
MSPKAKLSGSLVVPGDKSISHRALIFSALSRGQSKIYGLSPAEDCQSSASCLRHLGLSISNESRGSNMVTTVDSPGLACLIPPSEVLFAGNSGTTIRLLSGLVAGRNFASRFDGDDSLRSRPMSRVLKPLSQMGARINYEKEQGRSPFTISGSELEGQFFQLEVASAQVETALLLAGLQASGQTTVRLPHIARDHTARMFRFLNVPFTEAADGAISVSKLVEPVPPFELFVPGDISSAAFFMVAAACLPGANIVLEKIGMNPGRTLVLDVLRDLGADISLENEQQLCGEPVADIRVRGGNKLKGGSIAATEVAQGVDEIPILALAGCMCEGDFSVRGAAELRHKESDRLALIVENIRAAGGEIDDFEDGFVIHGSGSLKGGSKWSTKLDHRLAMSGLIAQLLCQTPVVVEETDSAAISYPTFAQDLARLL